MGSYLAKSKIGLAPLFPIPKYKKNISMKIFEYMQYGLPIVGSDFGPIKRFLEESNSGVCVNPEDGAEIWKAIKSILEDEKLYMKYSQNGKKAYKNKYNWTKMEENIINIFNNLA
ncbi:glycosyltransferase [Clostridium botulinum]|nr:glycosyltransferase [Clostridium botulinum]